MELLNSLAALVFAALFLLLPGWWAGWGLGLQGGVRLASAPALSLGLWAASSWVAAGLQIPWLWYWALPLLAIITLPFLVGRLSARHSPARWPLASRFALGWPLRLLVAGGAVVTVAPLWVASEGLRLPPQTWDGLFHLSGIEFIRQNLDPSPLTSLSGLYGQRAVFYPNLLHLLAALLPGSSAQAFTALTAALAALWPGQVAGLVAFYLSGRYGQSRPARLGTAFATVGAISSLGFPALLATVLGTGPYTLSVAVLPGVVTLGLAWVRLWRAGEDQRAGSSGRWLGVTVLPWVTLGVALAVFGVVSAHPAGLFNLAVLAGPPALWRFGVWVGGGAAPRRWRLAACNAVVGLCLLAAILLAPRLASMAAFDRRPLNLRRVGLAALADLPLTYPPPLSLTWLGGALLSAWAIGGLLVILRARRGGWVAAAYLCCLGLILASTGAWGPLRALSAPWYLQGARLMPLLNLCAYLLAGLALAKVVAALDGPVQKPPVPISPVPGAPVPGAPVPNTLLPTPAARHRGTKLVAALCAAQILASAGAGIPGRYFLAEATFDPQKIAWGTMATRSELDFITRSAALLPAESLIWADPFNGSPYYWSLGGRQVVFAQMNFLPSTAQTKVLTDLQGPASVHRLCQDLQRLGVTHYYADSDRGAQGAQNGAKRRRGEDAKAVFHLPEALLTPVEVPGFAGSGPGPQLYAVDYRTCQ